MIRITTRQNALLLEEADRLAKDKGWPRSLALSIMECNALKAGDRLKADAIICLLEKAEVQSEPEDPVFIMEGNLNE